MFGTYTDTYTYTKIYLLRHSELVDDALEEERHLLLSGQMNESSTAVPAKLNDGRIEFKGPAYLDGDELGGDEQPQGEDDAVRMHVYVCIYIYDPNEPPTQLVDRDQSQSHISHAPPL